MQPLRQHRKVDNCCPIPSSKSAIRPMRASSSRPANCLRISPSPRARKGGICHERHPFCQKLSALDASALWRRDIVFSAGGTEPAAELVDKQTAGPRGDRMGPTSAKFGPEMEGKDGQNSIQTAGASDAGNATNCAETNAISTRKRSRRSAEETHPAGAPALRCTQRRAHGGARLGGDQGNRMKDQIAKNTTSRLRIASYAHDLETALS